MKEKIIRILRIILFDAFKSRWAWRRVPTQWYFNYMNYLRRKRFTENPILPDCYNAQFIKGAKKSKYKRTLIITFAHAGNYNFVTYLKDYDTLHFYLKEMNYFMKDTLTFLQYIKKIILDNGYNKVICTGMSKGGSFAIIFASALADKCKFVQFYSLGFSPGHTLYPLPQGSFIHFVQFREFAHNNKEVMKNAMKFGNTRIFLAKQRENVHNYVIASNNELNDLNNAYILEGYCKYLKAFFIDCNFHFAVVNFLINNKIANDKKKIRNLMAFTLNNNKELGGGISDRELDMMTDCYMKVRKRGKKKLLSLNELINELINRGKITALYK